MTEKELRSKVVATAQKYAGFNEGDGSHRKIIDIYNGHTPRARGYKVTYTDAWCATYVSAIAILCGLTDIMPTECGCQKMIELYQKQGRWMELDSYKPEAGDVIMYDWDDSGVGDNTGSADHVGIVVSVSGNSIKVIEGNISNKVGYRTLQVNAKNIRGYCLPNYESKATEKEAAPAAPTTEEKKETSGALNRTPKWKGEVTASILNVRRWAGVEYDKLKSIPQIKAGTIVEVCDGVKASDGALWYYIRIDGKVYGFVNASYIEKTDGAAASATESAPAKKYEIGAAVRFNGDTHYTSSYATGKAKKAAACDAKVTARNLGAAHPYHVVGSKVHGWVDEADISG